MNVRSASTLVTILLLPGLVNRTMSAEQTSATVATQTEYSAAQVADIVRRVHRQGDPQRGAMVFTSLQLACASCHKILGHGGTVGPDLTETAKERSADQLVESIIWPRREVRPEYTVHLAVTEQGQTYRGYLVRADDHKIVLRDPGTGAVTEILQADIEERLEVGTLMPDGLAAGLTAEQQADLVRFLMDVSRADPTQRAALESLLSHAVVHAHGPAQFPVERAPLHPDTTPQWQHRVNRDRVYDFYTKQAEYFRQQSPVPPLLMEFPGLDGGQQGHWGNQDEASWADGRWNDADLGTLHCGVFRHEQLVVPRAVCIRLGPNQDIATCFNPDTLGYEALWSGGFLRFSSFRHGFMDGVALSGTPLPSPQHQTPTVPFRYRGYYRYGTQVVFAYRMGEQELLDAPDCENGQFRRTVAPVSEHPFRHVTGGGPAQWPQTFVTPIELGEVGPYAVDTIHLPVENPWKALLFVGGHDFSPDGKEAYVGTMTGDVWQVTDYQYPSRQATWKRFASGLHHVQGVWVDDDGIFVMGRDQITRLHDVNGDGEADYYECFSNAFQTSPAAHDFICGLQRDSAGNFYLASGNQGLVRVSSDGETAEVLATGFRNPDGLGLLADGTLTVPCAEGDWVPASIVCAVRPPFDIRHPLHYGAQGPRNGKPPELPLLYLPRGLDNSSGEQTYVSSRQWGPLSGQLVHLSYGAGSAFLVLRDEVDGQLQGAAVPLIAEFRSGAHRGRFHPTDGQLYVSGSGGWGTYSTDDGAFQRVRYTGQPVTLPVQFRIHENGVLLRFSEPIDPHAATQAGNHFAQCWNYRYSGAYGSAEYSSRHAGVRGHDWLAIRSAYLLADENSLFLEIPQIQPVNQLHLHVCIAPGEYRDIFATVHRLDAPRADIPNYQAVAKFIQPHPLVRDMAMIQHAKPNRWTSAIPGAREITIETGTNLTYATRTITVRTEEPLAITLSNPDVVPHNWVLVQPDKLTAIGNLANQLVADPDAFARHYVPQTDDVIAYTDIVPPGERFTIFIHAPKQPGRYPFLCTFPGHWMVMNGEMIVENKAPCDH